MHAAWESSNFFGLNLATAYSRGLFMTCGRICERRRFLKTGIQSVCAFALAPSLSAILSACNQAPLTSVTGPTTSVPGSANGIYTFSFADYPQLASPGGSIHVTIDAGSGAKDVYITRVTSNSVETVSAICTHAGCELDAYNSGNSQYDCPCHGSIFAADGSVIQGPAVVPLANYPSSLSGDAIEVTVF
jgi:Rieske Fe-S protein